MVADRHSHTEVSAVVFPYGQIEESGARAVRRRVPIGPTLNAWICRRSQGLRCLDRPAGGGQPAGPVDFDEGLSSYERAIQAIEHIEESVAIRPEHQLSG